MNGLAKISLLLVIVLVGAVVCLASPGNSGRMVRFADVDQQTRDTLAALTHASITAAQDSLRWLRRPQLLVAGLLTLLGIFIGGSLPSLQRDHFDGFLDAGFTGYDITLTNMIKQ